MQEIPFYCHIFYPGLLEQEPRLEQGLIVLLCESFYACKDSWKQQMLCHILNTRRAFLLCVFYSVHLALPTERKTCHMRVRGRQRAFLLCVFRYDSPDAETERKPCHTRCRSIASPLYEFLYVTQGFLFVKKSFHTGGRERASLLYVFYCDRSGYWTR